MENQRPKLNEEDVSSLIVSFLMKKGFHLYLNHVEQVSLKKGINYILCDSNQQHIGCFLFQYPRMSSIAVCRFKTIEEMMTLQRCVDHLIGNFVMENKGIIISQQVKCQHCAECEIVDDLTFSIPAVNQS